MNNEIGRKITSLTLMTIMLASAFAVGAPSVLPKAAAANANLFVSAENSQFQNYFSGASVIEVAVIDSDIKDTDKGKGEPDVTVNGNHLRMIQATDGNWYAYFADRDNAEKADAIQSALGTGSVGVGLDFGSFCSSTTASSYLGISLTETSGVAIPISGLTAPSSSLTSGSITGGVINANCAGLDPQAGINGSAVVREAKTPNAGTSATISGAVPNGQIGLNATYNGVTESFAGFWPFIQLYTFNPSGNVVVQYNKGGGVQSTTLTFDTVDQFAKLDFDRTTYPRGAQVDATMTDVQLNIDPTDEDSWTFGTASTNATVYYNIFNEDGTLHTNTNGGVSTALTGNLTNIMFKHNGILKMNPNPQGSTVLNIVDNADSILSATNGYVVASLQGVYNQPITFTESAPNTGVFVTYDENDQSDLVIASDAARGKSASFEFNQKTQSVVVGFGSATVSISPTDAEWNSGEKIPVTVVDSDANQNSKSSENLRVNVNSTSLIPSIRIGTPFTLGANGTETANTIRALTFTDASPTTWVAGNSGFYTQTGMTVPSVTVKKYSDMAKLSGSITASTTGLVIAYEKTAADLKKTVYDTRTGATTRLLGM